MIVEQTNAKASGSYVYRRQSLQCLPYFSSGLVPSKFQHIIHLIKSSYCSKTDFYVFEIAANDLIKFL